MAYWASGLVHSFHRKSGGLHSLRVAFVMWVTLKEGLGFGKGTRVELRWEVGQVFSRGRRWWVCVWPAAAPGQAETVQGPGRGSGWRWWCPLGGAEPVGWLPLCTELAGWGGWAGSQLSSSWSAASARPVWSGDDRRGNGEKWEKNTVRAEHVYWANMFPKPMALVCTQRNAFIYIAHTKYHPHSSDWYTQ